MKRQDIYNSAGGYLQSTSYMVANAYDKVGNLLNYQVSVYCGTAYANYYAYSYAKFDDYKETKVAGSSSYFLPGATNTTYDVNSHISTVVDSQKQWVADGEYGYYAQRPTRTRTRSFIGDADGTILRKTDNGNLQNLYYAGDKVVGSVSGTATAPVADFDFNYAPVSDSYPAMTPGNYTVVAGDTLSGIAYKAWGDAKLWYLVADANGLMTDGDGGCGGVGSVLIMIVAIVAAAVIGPAVLAAVAPETAAAVIATNAAALQLGLTDTPKLPGLNQIWMTHDSSPRGYGADPQIERHFVSARARSQPSALDALSSAGGSKVDFDMALLVIASGLYRWLARHMRGYADAHTRSLFRDLIATPADVDISESEAHVRFHSRARLPIFIASKFF